MIDAQLVEMRRTAGEVPAKSETNRRSAATAIRIVSDDPRAICGIEINGWTV